MWGSRSLCSAGNRRTRNSATCGFLSMRSKTLWTRKSAEDVVTVTTVGGRWKLERQNARMSPDSTVRTCRFESRICRMGLDLQDARCRFPARRPAEPIYCLFTCARNPAPSRLTNMMPSQTLYLREPAFSRFEDLDFAGNVAGQALGVYPLPIARLPAAETS